MKTRFFTLFAALALTGISYAQDEMSVRDSLFNLAGEACLLLILITTATTVQDGKEQARHKSLGELGRTGTIHSIITKTLGQIFPMGCTS